MHSFNSQIYPKWLPFRLMERIRSQLFENNSTDSTESVFIRPPRSWGPLLDKVLHIKSHQFASLYIFTQPFLKSFYIRHPGSSRRAIKFHPKPLSVSPPAQLALIDLLDIEVKYRVVWDSQVKICHLGPWETPPLFGFISKSDLTKSVATKTRQD